MEFAALSRQQQKSRLKEWNLKANQLKTSCASLQAPSTSESVSTYVSTPAYLGNEMPHVPTDAHDEPLTSVASIQALYKQRCKSDELKRIQSVQKTEKYKAWSKRMQESRRQKTEPEEMVEYEPLVTTAEQEDASFPQPQPSYPPGWSVIAVSYRVLSKDPIQKQEILASIRSSLLQGTPVHIENDTSNSMDSISDARLLVQQICIASSLFCDRAQDIVPRVEGGLVNLTLMPKLCPSNSS